MRSRGHQLGTTLFGLVIAAGGLYLAFRDFDLGELLAVLGQVEWMWIMATLGLTVGGFVLRGWRWRTLLLPRTHATLGATTTATMIGYFGNSVFPARLGEIMRAYVLARRQNNIDTAVCFGSIAVERLLDLVAVAILAALTIPALGPDSLSLVSWLPATLGILLATATLWGVSRSSAVRGRLRAWSAPREGLRDRFRRLTGSFLEGLLLLGENPRTGTLLLQTAIQWLGYLAGAWMLGRGVGLPLSPLEVCAVMVATSLAISIPAAPGYVGTFHAANVLLLTEVLAYDAPRAQAFAIVSHAVSWLPSVILGAAALAREPVRLRDLNPKG